MRMSASTVETPSVDWKSHMILLRHELPLSRQGVWTGITRQISMTSRKLGKRSRTWKVQSFHALDSHRTAVKTSEMNYFHLNSIHCKHRYQRYNSIGVAQRKLNLRNLYKILQLAPEKHSFLSKCRLTISCEHNNSFHLNFISKLQTYASILNFFGILILWNETWFLESLFTNKKDTIPSQF